MSTSYKNTQKFCSEDISLIENYDKAINDKNQIWDCHHRAETLPCGYFSPKDLKAFNLYYNRPACELIFLRKNEHLLLHHAHKRKHKCSKKLRLHKSRNARKFSINNA